MAGLSTYAQRWQRGDFYERNVAEDHFITEPMASNRLAHALAERILSRTQHGVQIFDVGAGDGSLLRGLSLLGPFELHGVDVRPRPPGLPAEIHWHHEVPHTHGAVLICHEFLDDVPCDVAEIDDDGYPRLVLLDDDQHPVLGPALTDPAAGPERWALLDWMRRWWPTDRPGSRVEIGLSRDNAWRDLLARIPCGRAFAIDYGHVLPERIVGTWDGGTLVGFRHGRAVSPTQPGVRNITAHVAMDAVAHASGRGLKRLTRQRRIWAESSTGGWSTGGRGDYLWLDVSLDCDG